MSNWPNWQRSALSSWGPGLTPDRDCCITILFYIPVCILSSKSNKFGEDSQPKPSRELDCPYHMTRIDLESFVCRNECGNRYATWYSTPLMSSFKTIYMRFDGFSTPVISFWLICTTRRWDRGSVWGHTLFLSEFNLFQYPCETPFCQSLETKLRFPVWTVYCPQKIVNVFFCQQKFSEKHNFFFDRLKRLLVVQILEVTAYQENAEHIRLITFH